MNKIEINEQNPSVLVCCYGTLRVGHGNYRSLLKGVSKFLGTYKTEPAFTMYGKTAGFPIVQPKGSTAIEYDLFEVDDDTVLQRLHRLEGCTGIIGHERNWYDLMEISTPKGKAYMYVQDRDRSEESIIESGNWNKR
jgi:gamma-glutamylcyclotransferase (GGCT)/AIG2-like uncharacterized protein YtfP